MALTFGAAFDRLEEGVKRDILKMLVERRKRYTRAMRMERVPAKVVLLADTPGPGRPTDPNYHHTPFYSTKNSSLWINRLLWEHGISEGDLLWFNTTLADGTPLDPQILSKQFNVNKGLRVVCLGGNAQKWLNRYYDEQVHVKVHHPQAWKRFHSKEHYPLIDFLEEALDLHKEPV